MGEVTNDLLFPGCPEAPAMEIGSRPVDIEADTGEWNGRTVSTGDFVQMDVEDVSGSADTEQSGFRIKKMANRAKKVAAGLLSLISSTAAVVAVVCSSIVALAVAVVAKTAFLMIGLDLIYPELRPHLPRVCQRIGDIISAQVNDMFAMIAMGLLVVSPIQQRDPHHIQENGGRPILMVHGYLGFGSNWTYLRHRLHEAGLGPAFTLDLGHPLQAIDKDYVPKVAAKIEEIQRLTGRSDVILIGHSMGGVVSSYYATHVAPKGTVTDVITLGSPLHGTTIAPVGVGECAQQMRRGSDLLRSIRKKIKEESDVRFFHLWSNTDQVILPNRSARVTAPPGQEHRIRSHQFDEMGHASYLFSDEVADKIVRYVRQVA